MKKYNFALLSKCNVLLVVSLDGWKESLGLTAEIEFAVHNRIFIVLFSSLTFNQLSKGKLY